MTQIPLVSRRAVPQLLRGAVLCALVACASARPAPIAARLVTPAQWPAVVDCVMLTARANALWADADSDGIVVTPGLTPLAQQRTAGRATVVGAIRVTPVKTAVGLRVTARATNWDPPSVGRVDTATPSATRTIVRQLDAQCLAAYPVAAAD